MSGEASPMLRFTGVVATTFVALLAGWLAVLGMSTTHQGVFALGTLTGPLPALTLELGVTPLAAAFCAILLTLTGPMTDAMREPSRETLEALPHPRILLAIGDCAAGEGPWAGAPAAGEGAGVELGATIYVRGCPPTPDAIRLGLAAAAAELQDPLDT